MDFYEESSESEEIENYIEEISIEQKIDIAEDIFSKIKHYCEANNLNIFTSINHKCISDLVSLID